MQGKERVVPFWMLNDALDKQTLTRQLEGMRSKGVGEVIANPRYGLPRGFYLSREWFECFGHIVNEVARLRMRVWIHDDINWPSGTIGGELTRRGGPYAAKILGYRDGKLQDTHTSTFNVAYQRNTPYLDVLSTDATAAFIRGTHEKYRSAFGRHFGETIAGVFNDEPGFYANLFGFIDKGTVPFTDDLFKEFEERRDYDPRSELPYIWEEDGARSRKIRQDYFETLSELYQERFLGPLRQWCHENNLLFIGHLLEEEDPLNLIKSQANPFDVAKHFDWAGFDVISALIKPRVIAARFAHSIAQIYGKPEVMAETMGGFGWEMPPEKMVELSQWHARHGTSVLVPHALFYSTRGDRRYESPPSLMEEPYWSKFGEFVQDFSKRVEGHTHGPSDMAIYYPVRAIWANYNPNDETAARKISNTLVTVSLSLTDEGLGFDYINDEALENPGLNYKHITLPRAEVLTLDVLRRLESFAERGGRLTFAGSLPRFAAKDQDQQEFEILMEGIVRSHNVEFVPLEVKASSSGTRLKGMQYRVWHQLSCYSPRYSEWLIRLKHVLLKR